MTTTIQIILMSRIYPNPDNPRKKISKEELTELSRSIKEIGVIQPITVRQQAKGFEIVCGHRRFEAAKMAGLEEMPCVVRTLTDEEAYEIMVTENLQRRDIDPFDESLAFNVLRNRGYDVDGLACKFGKSRSYIYGRIHLMELIDEFRSMYDKGDIDISHCELLSRLSNGFQKKMLEAYDENSYSNLRGRSVHELKTQISRNGLLIDTAPFDTSSCFRCVNNTKSDAIFSDMCDAVCENPECYNRKKSDYIFSQLEMARLRNPLFYIVSDWDLKHATGAEAQIIERCRKAGFEFAESNMRYISVNAANKYDFGDETPDAFSFGWKGFCFESENDLTVANPYKVNWKLDEFMKKRKHHTDLLRSSIILERIASMSDLQCSTYEDMASYITDYVLAVLVSNSYINAFGLSYKMDAKQIKERISNLNFGEKYGALLKFASDCTDDGDVDLSVLDEIDPSISEGTQVEAEKMFIDKCRECWHGYEEVTDEMVEEDLAARV